MANWVHLLTSLHKGAYLTSTYAPPLFLPCLKISGQKYPVRGGVVQYTQMLLPLFRADGRSYLYTYTVIFVKQKKIQNDTSIL